MNRSVVVVSPEIFNGLDFRLKLLQLDFIFLFVVAAARLIGGLPV